MTSNQKISDFYDNFKTKLIEDFIKPNHRVANAIKLALSHIPTGTKSVLDLGFGLGWSTFEFARHFPNAMVQGFDISEELTATASYLFQAKNLSYSSMDLTREFPKGKYDAIVLLDVFEHIPITERADFFGNIKKALTESGRVILTSPTVYHQSYLRKNKPEGLQPVDEDVDINVVLEFALHTNTNLAHFQFLDIWNSRDYLFAVIEKPYKYHTANINHYKNSANLMDFYSKYSLIDKSELSNDFLPALSRKQKIRYLLKSFVQ